MTRREFLRACCGAAGLFAACAVYPKKLFLTSPDPSEAFALEPSASDDTVSIVTDDDYARAVELALEAFGGIGRFVRPGDRVVVKPNIAWNSPPHLKATTDPVIVRTVVDLCFKANAASVMVFDRTCSNPKLSYTTSGIMDAAKEAGAKVIYVNDVSKKLYPSISVKGATFLKETTVNRHILESDVFINVPVAKHHSSADLTLGMKNLMGITGDNRSKWHWELHEAISDINLAVASTLTIIDATNLMLRNGPTGGREDYLKRTDTIIASASVVSADAEASKLFGVLPGTVRYLELAVEKRIGRIDGYRTVQLPEKTS
ncbi:MAG: DUF362 domain-containing protein [Spirochaetes bacterium]|nr:DUF362 domain-containing protein [Spirochaetota bacterium]